MLVVPLIVSSLIAGVARVRSVGDLGRLGSRTMLFYMATSMLAICTGLIAVNVIQPGVGANFDLEAASAAGSLPPICSTQALS